eukprot:403346297
MSTENLNHHNDKCQFYNRLGLQEGINEQYSSSSFQSKDFQIAQNSIMTKDLFKEFKSGRSTNDYQNLCTEKDFSTAINPESCANQQVNYEKCIMRGFNQERPVAAYVPQKQLLPANQIEKCQQKKAETCSLINHQTPFFVNVNMNTNQEILSDKEEQKQSLQTIKQQESNIDMFKEQQNNSQTSNLQTQQAHQPTKFVEASQTQNQSQDNVFKFLRPHLNNNLANQCPLLRSNTCQLINGSNNPSNSAISLSGQLQQHEQPNEMQTFNHQNVQNYQTKPPLGYNRDLIVNQQKSDNFSNKLTKFNRDMSSSQQHQYIGNSRIHSSGYLLQGANQSSKSEGSNNDTAEFKSAYGGTASAFNFGRNYGGDGTGGSPTEYMTAKNLGSLYGGESDSFIYATGEINNQENNSENDTQKHVIRTENKELNEIDKNLMELVKQLQNPEHFDKDTQKQELQQPNQRNLNIK